MMLPCARCGAEGRKIESRYGGNDPDIYDAGPCEACDGSGNEKCHSRGCSENAISFDDDGNALCEDCMLEYLIKMNGEGE